MNYIQRLFDAAAPSAPRAMAVPVAAAGGGSPIITADQRLGLFPDLVDPFAVPTGDAPVRAPDSRVSEPAVRERADDRPGIAATDRGPAATSGQAESRIEPVARVPTAPPPTNGDAMPRPVSALQRLAESAPLDAPLRHAAPTVEPESRFTPAAAPIAAPDGDRVRAAPTAHPGLDTPPARSGEAARPASAAPPLATPFRVTPDQFQPHGVEKAAPLRLVADPPPASAPPVAAAPSGQDLPPVLPQPIAPVARDAESPVARFPDALPPPPAQAPAPAPPERVIERIREVSVAPAAPAPPMTAAGQSVIGSLTQRAAQGWQPRQEGF
ncbi:hypothetical protein [Sphingomonas sp.]|uniref:hypothetical protein n=1 Tax=Sphingomonas sp. TaxID=28214 RepID=UPI003D6CD91C